jgi:hypothetical protein
MILDAGVMAGPGAKKLLRKIFIEDHYDELSIPVTDDRAILAVGIIFDLIQIVDLVREYVDIRSTESNLRIVTVRIT